MEGHINRGFAVQDEDSLQTHGSIQPELSSLDPSPGGQNIKTNRHKPDGSANQNMYRAVPCSEGPNSSSQDLSTTSTSSVTQNVEDVSDEHRIRIRDEQLATDACHRRIASLKLGMSGNNAEFDEETSLKSTEIPATNPDMEMESKKESEGGRFWHRSFSAYKSAAHGVYVWTIHVCVLVYVVAAITYWKFKDECNMNWCDGVGMLIIIVVLVYCGLLYYYIIKKHYGKALYNNVLKPINIYSDILLENRYRKIVICSLPFVAIVVFLGVDANDSTERLISCLGTAVILSLGFLFSKHRTEIQWRPVLTGFLIQFLLGLVTIRWSVGRNIFQCIGDRVAIFLGYSNEGARFVYGQELIDKGIFAFQALSVIFFLSFLVQILYYYEIMQWIVIKLGWLIQVSMGTTVCESVNAATSVFLGMSEAPLLLRPYLKDLTKSEMHAIMAGGFATVAGTVLAAYISFGVSPSHLITASVMSAPAALCFSKLFYPEKEETKNRAETMIIEKGDESSVLDAASRGAVTAIQLVLGIIANVIAFVSMVAFINGIISWLGMLVGAEGITLEYIFSKVFIPLAWVMGVEWQECEVVAQLIGLKTIVNEFVAYEQLGKLKTANKLSPRSEMIATYALCGFSNPGAVGISIGVLTTLAPSQKSNITEVAFRAFIAGSATCFLTACIAGMLMPNLTYTNDKMSVFNASLQVP